MSFLTDDEASTLKINRLILHVVGKGAFVPQSELKDIEGVDFFLDRIRDSAISAVHQFEQNSATKAILEQISGELTSFQDGAQELSRRFAKDHVGSSKTGAFFIIELKAADEHVHFYAMMKYDYREAIELYEKDGNAALRQIVQAFIKEKRAIQKACIVRVRSGTAELSVSAFDKMGDAPDLTDYFGNFLDVKRHRDTRELSLRMNEAVRKTLQDVKEHLPNNDIPAAYEIVRAGLRQRDIIDNDGIREAVFIASGRPHDAIRVQIEKVLNRHIKDRKIEGVEFRADKQVLGRAPRRRIRTYEKVVLEFPGELENHAVTKMPNGDGGWTITIQTAKDFVENGTVADISR